MLKKALSLILCLLILCSVAVFPTSAAVVEKGKIVIGTIEGITGDSVIVPIDITENPGISAITVSITYDSSALEFEESIKGDVLSEAEAVAHPSRNIIRFVTSEMGNKFSDGTLISFKFKIKETAEDKLYKIGMKFNSGDFCNWKLDRIMPTVTSGGVKVDYNEKTCPHKEYGEWKVAAAASCEENGIDSRICKKCGHTDLRENEPIGHEYSDIWTVDREATAEQEGLMSRHCIRCSRFVDQISFVLEQKEEVKVENLVGEQTTTNEKIEEIFKEQNPDKELTPNIPPKETEDDTESDTSSTIQEDQQKTESDTSSQSDSSENSSIEEENSSQNETNTEVNISDNSKIKTYYDKILEAFPNAESLIDIFKTAVIILVIIVIL